MEVDGRGEEKEEEQKGKSGQDGPLGGSSVSHGPERLSGPGMGCRGWGVKRCRHDKSRGWDAKGEQHTHTPPDQPRRIDAKTQPRRLSFAQ